MLRTATVEGQEQFYLREPANDIHPHRPHRGYPKIQGQRHLREHHQADYQKLEKVGTHRCRRRKISKNGVKKQLRLFFPKGKTIDTYKKQDIKNVNQTLLNRPLKSLDSYTPKDAFINVFDEDLFNKLF